MLTCHWGRFLLAVPLNVPLGTVLVGRNMPERTVPVGTLAETGVKNDEESFIDPHGRHGGNGGTKRQVQNSGRRFSEGWTGGLYLYGQGRKFYRAKRREEL